MSEDKTPAAPDVKALRQAIGADLSLLSFLHAKELDKETLNHLQSAPIAEHFGIMFTSKTANEALKVLAETWSNSKTDEDQDNLLEEIACDYAGIYLTHQLGVSPCESPWRDEDKLERQEPMFEVREWYKKYDLEAEDWRKRPDDHLSTQLAFTAYLIGKQDAELEETGRFLDQHLLKWIGEFAQKVAGRCATPFYAGLNMLTFAYLEETRDMIEAITGLQRPSPEEEEEKKKEHASLADEMDTAFSPQGGGPGW